MFLANATLTEAICDATPQCTLPNHVDGIKAKIQCSANSLRRNSDVKDSPNKGEILVTTTMQTNPKTYKKRDVTHYCDTNAPRDANPAPDIFCGSSKMESKQHVQRALRRSNLHCLSSKQKCSLTPSKPNWSLLPDVC